MISLIGYANAFAVLTGFGFFLNIEQYLKRNGKTKIIYSVSSYILLTGMILSDSKAVWGLLAIFAIVTYFTLKEKQQKIEYAESIFIGGIFAFLCSNQIGQCIKEEYEILAWVYFILFGALTAIVTWFIQKQNNKISQLDSKKLIIGMIIIALLIIVAVIVGLFLSKPLVLFTNEYEGEAKYKVAGIKSNTKYQLEFDISAISKSDRINTYEIIIEEENKYNDKVADHRTAFRTFEGTKTIKFQTTEQTTEVAIIFKSLHSNLQEELIINEVRINDNKEILNYYYLPRNVVQKIHSLFYPNKSVSERIAFIQDGVEIIKQNWFFGSGDNAWRYQQDAVQQYCYETDQMHSFPLKIWMDFGIIAICSYLVMIGYLVYNTIKRKEETFTKIALLFLILHSIIDFDMSFGICLVIFFIYYAVQMPKSTNMNINIALRIILIIILLIPIYFTTIGTIATYTEDNNYRKLLIYSSKYEETKIKVALKLNNWENVSVEEIKEVLESKPNYQPQLCTKLLEKEGTIENIQYVYEKMEKWLQRQNLQIQKIISINAEIQQIAEKHEQFYELICKYYDKCYDEIQNQEKNRYDNESVEMYQESLYSIYENAKSKGSE